MLSNIELILLSLINEKPSYAYELEKQIESRNMRMWVKIGVASVYQVLERLEKKGLLVSQREKEGKMPPRKRYHITAPGRKALAEGARRLLSGLEWYYLDLNVGLECSDLLSETEIATCLQKRLAKVRSNLKRLRELSRAEGNHAGGNNANAKKFAKKKAIIKNLSLFREAEENFLQAALATLANNGRQE